MGYADEAKLVQDLYLNRQPAEAAAAVPRDFIERTSIIGTREHVIKRIREYAEAGVGTLSISPYVGDLQSGLDTLKIVAEAYAESGVVG
jgi:alkanesulfonate monooxygenase SsuD/methylene tetrahydromethanopterin reductase-like flavin-dependent oxidoreductase (luciferase family)